jgi:hypothetical protein
MASYTIEKSLTKPKTKATIDSWPKLTEPSEAEVFVQKQITTSRVSHIKLMNEPRDSITIKLLPPLRISRKP